MSAEPWARTITVSTEPRVRVGCSKCAATGQDRGVWTTAAEADQVITDEVHRGRVVRLEPGVDLHVDSLVVVEAQHLPAAVPMPVERAVQWGELFEEVGETQWPAFLAWVESAAHVEDGDGLPSADAFEERYCGQWESFEEYAREWAEGAGLTLEWPEVAVTYFDWSRWARDPRHDCTVADAPGGVYVFRDL